MSARLARNGKRTCPCGARSSHDATCGEVSVLASDVVGRTLQYANQPILIDGDPLPVRLSRSRTVKGSR